MKFGSILFIAFGGYLVGAFIYFGIILTKYNISLQINSIIQPMLGLMFIYLGIILEKPIKLT